MAALGFSLDASRRALTHAAGDVELAINSLLNEDASVLKPSLNGAASAPLPSLDAELQPAAVCFGDCLSFQPAVAMRALQGTTLCVAPTTRPDFSRLIPSSIESVAASIFRVLPADAPTAYLDSSMPPIPVPVGIAVTLCEACPPDGRSGRFLAIEGDHSVTCKRETSDFFSKWVFRPPLSTAGVTLTLTWGATVTLTSSLGSVLASDGATGVVGAMQTSHALRLVRRVRLSLN